jgi:hypothetical protein
VKSLPNPDHIPHARPQEVRRRNNRIAYNARTQQFAPETPVTFMCECSDERCAELVRLTLTRYADGRAGADYIVAPGHQVDAADIVRVRDGFWLYRTE